MGVKEEKEEEVSLDLVQLIRFHNDNI